jgi:GAF domain-containing protein
MGIDPAALVKSIGNLETLDLDRGLASSVQVLINMIKQLLDADGTGLMLVDARGELRWASASDQPAQEVEEEQAELAEGPCAEAFSQATPVVWRDVDRDGLGQIVSEMLQARFMAGMSVPVELGGGPVGTLDVYAHSPREWHHSEISALQAYAGVLAALLGAAVAAHAHGRLARQLQVALDQRIMIEQAKGILMERHAIDGSTAFEWLRAAARSNRVKVVNVARDLLAGKPLPPTRLEGTREPSETAMEAVVTSLQQSAELHERIAELYEQQGRVEQAREERDHAAEARQRVRQVTGGQQPPLP